MTWVLVIDEGSDDYYVGAAAALYRDGRRVWVGYSNDEAEALVRAIVGDALEVRRVRLLSSAGGPFADDLDGLETR